MQPPKYLRTHCILFRAGLANALAWNFKLRLTPKLTELGVQPQGNTDQLHYELNDEPKVLRDLNHTLLTRRMRSLFSRKPIAITGARSVRRPKVQCHRQNPPGSRSPIVGRAEGQA